MKEEINSSMNPNYVLTKEKRKGNRGFLRFIEYEIRVERIDLLQNKAIYTAIESLKLNQFFFKRSDAFVPPKPNELESAY